MTQAELAKAAGLGTSTVADFELSRRELSEKIVSSIRAALEAAGVEFIPENGRGAGVRAMRENG